MALCAGVVPYSNKKERNRKAKALRKEFGGKVRIEFDGKSNMIIYQTVFREKNYSVVKNYRLMA